jgi:hypothetical protein
VITIVRDEIQTIATVEVSVLAVNEELFCSNTRGKFLMEAFAESPIFST